MTIRVSCPDCGVVVYRTRLTVHRKRNHGYIPRAYHKPTPPHPFVTERETLIAHIQTLPEGAAKQAARKQLVDVAYAAWEVGHGVTHAR